MNSGGEQITIAEAISTDGSTTIDTAIQPIGHWCGPTRMDLDSNLEIVPNGEATPTTSLPVTNGFCYEPGTGLGWYYSYSAYATDHLGTVRAVYTHHYDNSENISFFDYEPFGLEIPPSEVCDNTHRFTGHERDAETDSDYMHFRYYAGFIGRFYKPDNITSNGMDPQDWNRYSYVHGNPVIFVDPTGHLITLIGLARDKEAFMAMISDAIGFEVYEDENGHLQRKEGQPDKEHAVACNAFDQAASANTPKIEIKVKHETQDIGIDNFDRLIVDVTQLKAFPVKSPADHPDATTQGELITHILAEYTHEAKTHDGYPFSHPYGVKAESQYRRTRGQSPMKNMIGRTTYRWYWGNILHFKWPEERGFSFTLQHQNGSETRVEVIGADREIILQEFNPGEAH